MRRNGNGRWRSAAVCAVLMMGVVGLQAISLLGAQESGGAPQAARLSSVEGQVKLAAQGQALTDAAVANAPLFEGTQISTGDDGRAEIQFDDGSVVRLTPNSTLTLTALHAEGNNGGELLLESGLAYFELQDGKQNGSLRVLFGEAVATASGSIVLRVNFDTPPGELAVFSGNVHLERGRALTADLQGGESITLNGADPSRYSLTENIEPDSWDVWNADRDQVLNKNEQAKTKVSAGFANGSNPAWSELDTSGVWYNTPDDGYVWSPYDASNAGWEPYASGYWMWTPRFGNVWVSGYSWGYMPFQCGLWNYYDSFGWGWAPGACSPWWFVSTVYIGPNIGRAPIGYRPVRLPQPPPRLGGRPRPLDHAMVAVNRTVSTTGGTLPARQRNTPVTLGGQSLMPVRPLSPRPQYDHTATSGGSGGRNAYSGSTSRFGYAGAPVSGAANAPRPGYNGAAEAANHPNAGQPPRTTNPGESNMHMGGTGTPPASHSGGSTSTGSSSSRSGSSSNSGSTHSGGSSGSGSSGSHAGGESGGGHAGGGGSSSTTNSSSGTHK